MEKSSQNEQPSQVVTVTLLRFSGFRAKWWAFQQMGAKPFKTDLTKGLQFVKLMGSGGAQGFSILPNWGVYGLLCVWESAAKAQLFFEQSTIFQQFKSQSTDNQTVFLKTSMAHGQWDKQRPFEVNTSFDKNAPLAVLTRATIKPRFWWHFWQYVPKISKSMQGKKGLIFSVGIGELPIIQQATFSLWASAQDMMQYAYQSKHHAEVVKKTRELDWYSEELFARFAIIGIEGKGFFEYQMSPSLKRS
jgi:hypothetical protein